MKLFQVRLRGSFDGYYVEAGSFDDASKKVIDFLRFNKGVDTIFTSDGSLMPGIAQEENIEIGEIKVVSDFIIK